LLLKGAAVVKAALVLSVSKSILLKMSFSEVVVTSLKLSEQIVTLPSERKFLVVNVTNFK
jgi:hypothetical protein